MLLQSLDIWVFEILYWLAVPVGLFAFIHAALQRADAYTATDKLTKPAWLAILVLGAAFGSYPWQVSSSYAYPISLISVVAAAVYLTDVRPAVRQMRGRGNGGRGGPYGPW